MRGFRIKAIKNKLSKISPLCKLSSYQYCFDDSNMLLDIHVLSYQSYPKLTMHYDITSPFCKVSVIRPINKKNRRKNYERICNKRN